jgi:hypothetical protein
MVYEDYMVEEDLNIEQSMRDIRLPAASSGMSDISAMRAAQTSMFSSPTGMSVENMLRLTSDMNTRSRQIRKEYSEERKMIAGRNALSSLTSSLDGIEGELARAQAIRDWSQQNPVASQYDTVKNFLQNETQQRASVVDAATQQSILADKIFEEKQRNSKEQQKIIADDTLLRNAFIEQGKWNANVAQAIGTAAANYEDPDAKVNLHRIMVGSEGDQELMAVTAMVASGLLEAGSSDMTNQVYGRKMENITSYPTPQGMQNVSQYLQATVEVMVENENGEMVLQEFSPTNVPNTKEGREALGKHYEMVKRSAPKGQADAYRANLEDWRKSIEANKELNNSVRQNVDVLADLLDKAKAGDTKARNDYRALAQSIYFDTAAARSKVKEERAKMKASIEAEKEDLEIQEMRLAMLNTKSLMQARGFNEKIQTQRLKLLIEKNEMYKAYQPIRFTERFYQAHLRETGGSYDSKEFDKLLKNVEIVFSQITSEDSQNTNNQEDSFNIQPGSTNVFGNQ